jgi:hypothetical protein
MRYSLLLPVLFLGLAGCTVSSQSPGPAYGTAYPAYGTTYAAPVEVAPVVVARPMVVVP